MDLAALSLRAAADLPPGFAAVDLPLSSTAASRRGSSAAAATKEEEAEGPCGRGRAPAERPPPGRRLLRLAHRRRLQAAAPRRRRSSTTLALRSSKASSKSGTYTMDCTTAISTRLPPSASGRNTCEYFIDSFHACCKNKHSSGLTSTFVDFYYQFTSSLLEQYILKSCSDPLRR